MLDLPSATLIHQERAVTDIEDGFDPPLVRLRFYYREHFLTLIEQIVCSLHLSYSYVTSFTEYGAVVDLCDTKIMIFDLNTVVTRSSDDPVEANTLVVVQGEK